MSEKDHRPRTKTWFMLITYGILLYMGLQNFSSIKGIFTWIFAILQPVAYGICIAFIINLFLNFFRNKVFKSMANSPHKWEQKLCPALSAFCTALVALILLALVIFMIIPQLTTAVNTLIEKMPSSQDQVYNLVMAKLTEWHTPDFVIKKIDEFNIDWDTTVNWLTKLMDGKVETMLGTAFSATASFLSTATNLLLGLIISIYLLAQKERVIYVVRKVIQLMSPQRYHERIFRVLHLANHSFASFLTGQFIEAIIIGTLCTIGLYIFRFPYAATIGILTGITALIPIIGAWIGGGVGALLVATVHPEKVIWFLVFIFVLQQLEGQFIYPKVVGNSVGLPGLLVLVAVIFGGGFGGILGIIFMVPVFAIIYQLLKEAIDQMPDDAEPLPAEGVIPAKLPPQAEAQPEPIPEPIAEPAKPAPAPKQTNVRKKHRKRK